MTAWYASLLAGALVLFGASVYLGLQRYLDSSLRRVQIEQARSIGEELLASLPAKGPIWLKSEINEHYAPEVNGCFIRVTRSDGTVVYASGPPKDGSFDPGVVPTHLNSGTQEYSTAMKIPGGHQLRVEQLSFSIPDGTRYWVESGAPDQQIEDVLHGLLLTLAGYTPFIISLAMVSGYWLVRRALRPVDDVTQRAEGITSTNLSERLPVIKTGDELERLSTSLNGMIARLEDAFRHINRFSADASHELRTPLTILQLELEAIAQHHRLSPEMMEQIGSALEETQRLSKIVDNLLTISRLDAGEARMEKVRLDLAELASSTTDQMHLLAEEKSISLHCNPTGKIWVQGDKARLKQVIVNLVDNAIKYTPEGGAVAVVVAADRNTATLEVADNGIGIAAEALPHVFERFYRADKARSRESGGSGLGLAIVKAICNAHSGDVKIVSSEGVGSRFIVELPHVDPYAREAGHKDKSHRGWTTISEKTL
jgi:heavy metal sensor kinase